MFNRMTTERAQAIMEEHDVTLHDQMNYVNAKTRSCCAVGLVAVQEAGSLEAARDLTEGPVQICVGELVGSSDEECAYLYGLEDGYENFGAVEFGEVGRVAYEARLYPYVLHGYEDGVALRNFRRAMAEKEEEFFFQRLLEPTFEQAGEARDCLNAQCHSLESISNISVS